MTDENMNKRFIKSDPGMSKSAIVMLVVAALLVFGVLAYVLIVHGDKLALR